MVVVVPLQITVSIPVVVVVRATRVHLDKPHTSFDKSPCQDAFSRKVIGLRLINPVETVSFFGLLRKIHCFRSIFLHLVGKFVTGDSGSQLGVSASCGLMLPVFIQKTVEQAPLGRPTHPLGRCKIKNGRSFGSHHHALVGSGHVPTGPVLRAANRSSFLIQHDHKSRQIFVFTAQTIGHPGPECWRTAQHLARIHHEHS